jgi:actin
MSEYSDPSAANQDEVIVIIDIGESYTKVGIAGEEKPMSVFPTITGTEKYKSVMVDVVDHVKKNYVGEDCVKMRGVLKIKHPISRGNVMDWDSYYAILTHIFYDVLRVEATKTKVVYAEPALSPPQTKQYIAQVLFQTYQVKAVNIASAPLLAIFSAGLTTGVIVESGEGLTWIVPIIDGRVVEHAVQKLPLAATDVHENLKGILMRYGVNMSYSAQREMLRDLKEKNCFVALDPDNAIKDTKETVPYILPDGESVNINMEIRVKAAEILFHPEILGYQCHSIQQAIIYAISRIDRYYWRELLRNIVLSGGNTLFQGLELRLEKELNRLLPQLGPLPELPVEEVVAEPPKKELVNVKGPEKIKDTCPSCGEEVNLTEVEFCPVCATQLKGVAIEIPGMATEKTSDKCSSCGKKILSGSDFCPFCGQKVVKIAVPIKNKTKTLDSEPDFDQFAGEFASEFVDDDEPVSKDDKDKIIRIICPEKREIAIYNGASILGSLPSSKKLFVTYAEFQQDPNSVDRNLADLL